MADFVARFRPHSAANSRSSSGSRRTVRVLEYFEVRNAAQLGEAMAAIEKTRSDAVLLRADRVIE